MIDNSLSVLGTHGSKMQCCLILRDVPENTELGIDMKFWRVGKHFRGIKDIPLGFHYVYFSAVNTDCKSGQRTGFGIWVTQPGFIVKQWIPEEEDFIDVQLTSDDVERYQSNFAEISLYLGPYPSECHRDWVALSNLIGPCTMDRLFPICGRVQSCTQFQSEPSSSQQRLTAKAARDSAPPVTTSNPEDLLPKLDVVPGTEVRFTEIPKNPMIPQGCTPLQITAYAMDRSYTLDAVLSFLDSQCIPNNEVPLTNAPADSQWSNRLSRAEKELLAELQFSYVVFLLNHVIDGWSQWRRILQLVANCEKAVSVRPNLYIGLITVLYHQLFSASQSRSASSATSIDAPAAELADLFFSEITCTEPGTHLSEPAFLPSVMRTLLRNVLCVTSTSLRHLSVDNSALANTDVLTQLQKRAEGFCHSLERRFQWNLNPDSLRKESYPSELSVDDIDWDGDEAPVIVQ